jgi:hypothetical protein
MSMFQVFQRCVEVFYIDVAKVDQDVAHVAMSIYICFKYMFQMFHLFISSGCCKVDLDAIYIYASVSGVFIHMLQVFHLDVF